MKITIDRDGCIECGSCESLCPQVFVLPPGDKAIVIGKYREDKQPAKGEVGADLVKCVTDACESCPVEVIHTE